ncbi:hypothetical protein ACTFIZ_004190 [Dictyostelium cf. discoideum]
MDINNLSLKINIDFSGYPLEWEINKFIHYELISGYVDFEMESDEFLDNLNKLEIQASVEKSKTHNLKTKMEKLKNKREYLQTELNNSKGFFMSIFNFFFGYNDNLENELSKIKQKIKEINENMTESQMEIFIEKTQKLMKHLKKANQILEVKSNLHYMKLINEELLKKNFILCC